MITARKLPAFDAVVQLWVARLLRRRFHAVRLAGGEHLRACTNRAVVGCVNHTNWWDGFILYVLSHRRLPHEIYLAMEERNLRRYRFFRWLGVFGVDLGDPGNGEPPTALPSLRYAVRLLSDEKRNAVRLVWMFVQGALVSPRRRVEVKPGASFLARRAGATLLPLVVRYEWLQESRPSVFVRVGAPLEPGTDDATLAGCLNDLLALTDAQVERGDLTGWEDLLPAKMSINKRWDYVRHRLRGGRREDFARENK